MAERPKFNPNALAEEYAGYCGIEKREGESDADFRSRVAGKLRSQGNFIEAHEAYFGRQYDDPDQGPTGPMAEIFGAVALAMQGRKYSPDDPERQIAAGVVAQAPEDPSKALLRNLFDALEPGTAMDLLDGFRGEDKK